MREDLPVTEQAKEFEKVLNENLNKFCPEKQLKLSSQDKLFITSELKRIDRLKNREYLKKGKTEKYLKLKKEFDLKYKEAAKKYLDTNLEALREANPGQAFSVLKRLGANLATVQMAVPSLSLLMKVKTCLLKNQLNG